MKMNMYESMKQKLKEISDNYNKTRDELQQMKNDCEKIVFDNDNDNEINDLLDLVDYMTLDDNDCPSYCFHPLKNKKWKYDYILNPFKYDHVMKKFGDCARTFDLHHYEIVINGYVFDIEKIDDRNIFGNKNYKVKFKDENNKIKNLDKLGNYILENNSPLMLEKSNILTIDELFEKYVNLYKYNHCNCVFRCKTFEPLKNYDGIKYMKHFTLKYDNNDNYLLTKVKESNEIVNVNYNVFFQKDYNMFLKQLEKHYPENK